MVHYDIVCELASFQEREVAMDRATFLRLREGAIFISSFDETYFVHETKLDADSESEFHTIVCSTHMRDDVATGFHDVCVMQEYSSRDVAIASCLQWITQDAGREDSIHEEVRDLASMLIEITI